MATPAQTLANQENAQQSTGPRTAEGKRVSSRNATKHGLTGQAVLLPGDDAEIYAGFRLKLLDGFAPVGPVEELLVQTIVDAEWRLERVRVLEANLLALAQFEPVPEALSKIVDELQRRAAIQAHGFERRAKTLHNLQLQEARLQRTLFKALEDLQSIQQTRKQLEQSELAQAINVRAFCRKQNRPFEAAEFGFDFTDETMDRETLRVQASYAAAQAYRSRAAA